MAGVLGSFRVIYSYEGVLEVPSVPIEFTIPFNTSDLL